MHPANPDIEDEYYINWEEQQENANTYQDEMGSQYDEGVYQDPGSVAPSQAEEWGEDAEMSHIGEGGMEDGGFDEELAAELAERVCFFLPNGGTTDMRSLNSLEDPMMR